MVATCQRIFFRSWPKILHTDLTSRLFVDLGAILEICKKLTLVAEGWFQFVVERIAANAFRVAGNLAYLNSEICGFSPKAAIALDLVFWFGFAGIISKLKYRTQEIAVALRNKKRNHSPCEPMALHRQ